MLNKLSKKLGVKIDEWLDLLDLSSFGVQFRYEALDFDDEPLDRQAILERVTQLMEASQKAMQKR